MESTRNMVERKRQTRSAFFYFHSFARKRILKNEKISCEKWYDLGRKDGWCCGEKAVPFFPANKNNGLIAALLVFVIGVLTITLAVQHTQGERRQAEQLAVQTARTISYMPPVKELIKRKDGHAAETQEVIEQMKEQTGAFAIYVLDEKGDIRSASGKSGLKKLERSREILFGGSHVSETKADGRRVIRGARRL